MSHRPPVRIAGAGLALIALCSRLVAAEPVFAPVATAAQGLAGNGIALFVPAPLNAGHLPPSLCLVSAPQVTAPLPAGWTEVPQFSSDGSGRFRATVAVGPGVDLYGSGEVVGPLRRNGQTITLWNTDNYTYLKDEGRRLYQSHPWILGVRADGTAFGVLFDTIWKASLSCAGGITLTCEGPPFPVVVIDRASPAAVLAGLAELTGTMALPPRWALGYQQCRWSYAPAARVREIADGFRSRRIPCDVVWMDIDYMDGFRIFTFDPKGFADPGGLNAYLHARGFKSAWMIDPGVKVDPGYAVYQAGGAQGVWVQTAAGGDFQGGVWPGPCVFPDFTRPATRTWWAALYGDFLATGVDGVWNDMNEPAVFDGPDKTMPEDNWHRGGDDLPPGPHRQYHNVYGMLMARATREGLLAARPDRRPFVLTRASFLGGQRYAATWTGDNASTDANLRLSVPMTLNLGLSGQPFNGPDLGGFGGNATPELWSRWIGFGAFFPFCRGHAAKGTNDKEPWAFGAPVERTARMALERRYRLLPHLYSLFREAARTGLPVMRPVFLADPADGALRGEEQAFLLGADLLVVPRWAANPRLPRGVWREVTLVPGDLGDADQASLRLRAGSILPLGRVVQSTAEESLDPLTLLVCPDDRGAAEGRLYEDAGDGFGYRDGDYLLTTYRASTQNGRVVVAIAAQEGRRARPARQIVIEVVDGQGQRQVGTANGL